MPDWKSLVRRRLAPLDLSAAAEADLVEELSQHLEDRYQELRAGGASGDEAYKDAVSEIDDMVPLQAGLRKQRRPPDNTVVVPGDAKQGRLAGDLWRDVRYALRGMRKNPAFVLFVILTLALGIGANIAVFTVIDTLLLNPLPVRNAASLASVAAYGANGSASGAPFPISYADLTDYRARNQVFESLAGYTSPRGLSWRRNGATQSIFAEFVTANYFDALGLKPARGRFFSPEEDRIAGEHDGVILNYGTWKLRFGGAENIIGQKVNLNNLVFTIIGVAPPEFMGVNAIFGPDLWLPATVSERLMPGEMRNALEDRAKAVFLGVGRLEPGVSRARAQANMTAISSALARQYPADEGHTVTVRPIRDALFASSSGSSTPMVFGSATLLIVVVIVLLIACSNVANLLSARSAARHQEMAIRLAIGASRRRLVRQLLTESVCLALLSGAVGLFLGYGALRLLFGSLPASSNFPAPKFDGAVLAFILAVSLATGFLFGTIPALKASRANVAEALKEEARTLGRSRRRASLANVLLVSQVAFSFLLMAMASLFLRSIQGAYHIDPGFQTSHLAVFMTNPAQAGYNNARTEAFYRDVRDRAEKIPGVQSVSWSSNLPLWARPQSGLVVEGRQKRSRTDVLRTIVNTVDRGYFETAGVKIVGGREFAESDGEGSIPVAIVNKKLADDYFPEGAIGKRIQIPGETRMRQIVGVARNGNYTSWGESPQACVYVPLKQNETGSMTLYVRTVGPAREILRSVEGEIRASGPQTVVSGGVLTGGEIVQRGLFFEKVGVMLLSIFGLLALGLASIGLYGILAYAVQQRTREIGVRIALGARRGDVLGMILREGMSVVLTGMALGIVAALVAGRLVSGMLYGVGAGDPISMAAAAVVLSAVALLACYLPGYRAARVDPLTALRES